MTVTLINQSKRMQTIILYHHEVCVKAGRCVCKNGRPSSIIIPVGHPCKEVFDGISYSSDFQRLKSSKQLLVIHEKKKELPPPEKGKGKGGSHRKKKNSE